MVSSVIFITLKKGRQGCKYLKVRGLIPVEGLCKGLVEGKFRFDVFLYREIYGGEGYDHSSNKSGRTPVEYLGLFSPTTTLNRDPHDPHSLSDTTTPPSSSPPRPLSSPLTCPCP